MRACLMCFSLLVLGLFVVVAADPTSAQQDCFRDCWYNVLPGMTGFQNEFCCDWTAGQKLSGSCTLADPNHDTTSCWEQKFVMNSPADCECENNAEIGERPAIGGPVSMDVYDGDCNCDTEECEWTADPANPIIGQTVVCIACP